MHTDNIFNNRISNKALIYSLQYIKLGESNQQFFNFKLFSHNGKIGDYIFGPNNLHTLLDWTGSATNKVYKQRE